MRVYVLLAVVTGALNGASPGGCTTPLGLPCMIVESVHELRSILVGRSSYRYEKSQEKAAFASDGSVSYAVTLEEIPLFGNSQEIGRSAALYLGPSDRVVRIFHKSREFSNREPIIWHDRPYRRSKAGDATCASGILHHGNDFRLTGEHTILNTKAMRWYRSLGNGGYEEQYLAPSLDCLALRAVRVDKNMFRIPVFTDRREVTSIVFGEPDRAAFQIPPNYRQVPDPSEARLRSFTDMNQRRRTNNRE